MAKRSVNKSEKIREALLKYPDKSVADIASDLEVTTGLVYAVKRNMQEKEGKEPSKRGRPAKSESDSQNVQGNQNSQIISAALKLIEACGNAERATKVIRILEDLENV